MDLNLLVVLRELLLAWNKTIAARSLGRTQSAVSHALQRCASCSLVVAESDLVVTRPRSFAEHMAKRVPLTVLPLPIAIPRFRFSIGYGAAAQSDPAHAWFRGLVPDVWRSVVS